uniref:Rho-GAP domain-containing protein n=1 Tax=Globodera pallida TaxID=36090 RepID=A0A183BPV1_GLOPA
MYQQYPSSSIVLSSSSSSLPSLADQITSAALSIVSTPESLTPPSPVANYANLMTDLCCSTTSSSNSDKHVTSFSLANNKSPLPLQVINPCYRQSPPPTVRVPNINGRQTLQNQRPNDAQRQNHYQRLNSSHSKAQRTEEQSQKASAVVGNGRHSPHSAIVILHAISSPLFQQKTNGPPKMLANKRTISVQTVGNDDYSRPLMGRPTAISLDKPLINSAMCLHCDHFFRVDSMNVEALDWLHNASVLKLGELCKQFSTVSDSHRWFRRVRSVIRQFRDKTHLSSVGSSTSVTDDSSTSKPTFLYGTPLSSIVPFTSDGSPLPRFVYDIMEWLKGHAQTSDEIFRKSGSKVRIREIREACSRLLANQPIPGHLLTESSPYDVADALKQYFMTNCPNNGTLSLSITAFCCCQPNIARLNRMSSLNLATCWMPTLFKMPGDERGGGREDKRRLMRRKTIGMPARDSLTAVQGILMTMIDQWERLLYLPNNLAKEISIDKRWTVCHDMEMPMKNGQFDFSKELQINFRQQLFRLKEDFCLSFNRWENWELERVFPDGSQLFTRTVNDMVLLKTFSVQTAIAASPNLVLAAILHNRHLWDSQVKDCQRIGPSLQNFDIVKITYKALLDDESEKSTFLARCWLYSKIDDINSVGMLVERSIVPRNVCPSSGENHVSFYKSEFLVVPVCSGHSHVIHISRADFRGKCLDWYDKVYGALLVQNLRRLKQLIQRQQNGFRRGTIVFQWLSHLSHITKFTSGTVQMPHGGIMSSGKMSSGYKTLSFGQMSNRNGKRQNDLGTFKHAEDGGGERTAKSRQMADESDLEEFAQFFKFGDLSKQSDVILKNIRQIKHRKTPSGTSVIVSDEAEPKKRLENIGVGEEEEAFADMEQMEPKCNSLVLRKLMIDNMNDSPMDSKRAINLATEHHFGGDVDVICSRAHFSYIYTSFLFCEVTNGFVACVAHRQSK